MQPRFNKSSSMPSDMRLQCPPCEDTPPSTRPPSVASSSATSSSSGLPQRSISTDSLHTTSSSDKPTGEEYIPTRLIRASPKANSNAMQFVKTGPAMLHKSAKEQMKKAEVVKSLRKTSLQEEEEWQSSSSTIAMAHSEEQDWQSNLDKWKSSRRKRNEDVLERVIEIKKSEQEEEFSKTRRKSKTFNEMREDKRGRRFNLVVHDDDNNDLSDLGLTSGQKTPSLSDPQEEPEMKFADQKSDAGFCTGSDTGSDGVFAEVEDNISDTSSALGDKREIHDSLLESGGSTTSSTTVQKDGLLNGHVNGHVNVNSSISVSTVSMRTRTNELYTYDKAIEDYKQFAENSAKKRTSSVTSLSSTASGSKDEEKPQQPTEKGIEPPFLRRERSSQMKIDLDKRRSMFELRDIDPKWSQQQNKINNRKSMDVGGRGSSTPSLRSKVASFEHLNELGGVRARGITPPRDTKFKEKLKNFSEKERERGAGGEVPPPRKKTPERDQNFYQKLQSFTRMETNSSQSASPPKMVATPPPKMVSAPLKPSSLKITPERGLRRTNAAPPTPLKDRIASFENLSPSPTEPSAPWRRRELSVSMENLHKSSPPTNLSSAPSVPNLTRLNRRAPTTPFMVVEVDEKTRPDEEACVKRNVSREYEVKVNKDEEKEKITGDSVGVSKQVTAQPFKESNVAQQRVPEIPSYTSELPVPKPQMLDAGKLDSRTTRTLPAVPQSSRSLPEVPVKSASSRKLPETPDSISRILPELPPKIPDMPPPALPESSTWVDVTECNGIEAPGEVSPPVPPPRVPIVEDPYNATSSYKDVNGMEEEGETIEYGDLDIDEVIDNYEHLSQAITIGDGGAFNETLSDKYETSRTNGNENYYEKILDDDPLYENIYEKVEDEINEEQALVNREAELVRKELDHHYQTLDEIHREKTALSSHPALLPAPAPLPAPSPSLPPKNKGLSVFEVLDVTWTEDVSSTPAAPPSVPPPPPPEEEEGPEIDEPTPKVAPPTVIPSPNPVDTETRPTKPGLGSPQSTKQDLRKKMSDFLGSKPQVEEELTMKPPPDVSEILRQERETERMIVQKQASLVRDSPLLDFDFSQPHGRAKYTWEDRMKADGPKPAAVDLDESTDHLEFHTLPPLSSSTTLTTTPLQQH